jgi:pimeloyl-ACP methyl ester carboxylesterase
VRPPAYISTCCVVALGLLLTAYRVLADAVPAELTGLHDVVLTQYSPLSANTELARRLLSPLTAARLPQLLARSEKGLTEQPINLAEETFLLYVPAHAPVNGYALLIFVPPSDKPLLPHGWGAVLDRYGVIFVSAARSGNDASPLGRREPLALLAAYNMMRRYMVNPERVYVGGFSGGARVALRLTLAYPDVFRGALLNAGSDPIGDAATPLPPADLLRQFQESTRLVYVTGDADAEHLAMDAQSIHSMRQWCVSDIDAQITLRTGHEIATPAALERALRALQNPRRPDASKLEACRSNIESMLTAQLNEVRSFIAAGKRSDAEKRLHEIDTRFGGVAAPLSVELARQSGAHVVP